MHSINNILVCIDPVKEHQPAVDKAIYLAKAFDASIELLQVVYHRGLVSNLFFSSDELEAAKTGYINSKKHRVESYMSLVKNAGIDCSFDVVWHKPLYEAIIQKANTSKADLVIKSTHHHPTINKVFFTPNDWQLLKSCPVPLILAKDGTGSEYKNILTAIDPTRAHDKLENLNPLIVKTGLAMAKAVAGECHVTHCHDPISYQLWSDIGMGMGVGMGPADFTMGEENYNEYLTQIKQSQQKSFDKITDSFEFKPENKHLEEGYPETLLPELVEKLSIDLLVLGTTYHSGFVGSTAEKILDQVNCDILSVQVSK